MICWRKERFWRRPSGFSSLKQINPHRSRPQILGNISVFGPFRVLADWLQILDETSASSIITFVNAHPLWLFAKKHQMHGAVSDFLLIE